MTRAKADLLAAESFEKLADSRVCDPPGKEEELKTTLKNARDPEKNRWAFEFKVTGTLGEGGSGVVHEAIHIVTGHKVALKCINLEGRMHWEDVKQEIELQSSFRHPGILRCYGWFLLPPEEEETDDEARSALVRDDISEHIAVLILEICPNGSLLDLLLSKKLCRLPEIDVARYIAAIAAGLHYLHSEKGVMHRDVKPSNLLFTDDWMIKIADFDVSAHDSKPCVFDQQKVTRDSKPRRKTLIGTKGFTAPEIQEVSFYRHCDGPGYDKRVDVFSLGVTGYAMLVGTMPFSSRAFDFRSKVPPTNVLRAQVNVLEEYKAAKKRAKGSGDKSILKSLKATRNKALGECFSLKSLNSKLSPLEFPDFVTDDAKDFLRSLLHAKPCDRMTLEDLPKHRWIRKHTS